MTIDDVNMQLIKMPCKIRAAVTANEDGSYTLFVNKNISIEQQREAVLHELRHIENGDLFCEDTADEIEARTHNK